MSLSSLLILSRFFRGQATSTSKIMLHFDCENVFVVKTHVKTKDMHNITE